MHRCTIGRFGRPNTKGSSQSSLRKVHTETARTSGGLIPQFPSPSPSPPPPNPPPPFTSDGPNKEPTEAG